MSLGGVLGTFDQSSVRGSCVAKMVKHSFVLGADFFWTSHDASSIYVVVGVVVTGATGAGVGTTTPEGAGEMGPCIRTERTSHASSTL